jgi:hypothetical protein
MNNLHMNQEEIINTTNNNKYHNNQLILKTNRFNSSRLAKQPNTLFKSPILAMALNKKIILLINQ